MGGIGKILIIGMLCVLAVILAIIVFPALLAGALSKTKDDGMGYKRYKDKKKQKKKNKNKASETATMMKFKQAKDKKKQRSRSKTRSSTPKAPKSEPLNVTAVAPLEKPSLKVYTME